ncbi:MAG: ribonuclease HII [Acidobacteria bacterium]|nr:ribonuclease HII [Acidobacteriota bacterium]
MKGAKVHDPVSDDGSDLRVSLFSDLRVTELGLDFESQAREYGYQFIAGVDEVGRGCLAGPVVAGACILDPGKPLPEGLNDSKKVDAELREQIASELKESCIAYAIGQIEADEIDRINILEATKRAMLAAITALDPAADFVLIDALHLKACPLPQQAIIKGDTISASIAAASILAKTYRDALMRDYDAAYPLYGFGSHKGYAAPQHWQALNDHGPCSIHRMSFQGVVPAEPVAPRLMFE